MSYIELHAHSAYSFLDGASLPEELAVRAAELGYSALALTDHDGVYGSLEFAHAAKAVGVKPITGAEATLADGSHVTLLVESPRGYANLCRLLTAAHAHERLNPRLDLTLLTERNEGLVCLSGCARHGLAVRNPNAAARLARAFGRDRFFVELQRPYSRGDARRNAALRDLARELGVRTIATGDPHAHHPRRLHLQDVLVAVKHKVPLEACEAERHGNGERALLSPTEATARFPDDPGAVQATAELAERLEFDLTQELGYRYPDFSDGLDPADVQLARVCERAFQDRYRNAPASLRTRAEARLREELALITELGLSGFFLLHWEVLELAREVSFEVRGPGSPRHLLPPGRGRGSSVGSIVCFLTGLSHVDPVSAGLTLGRFLNRELVAVPDIDLDFPRDIREKLIVAVIEKYGPEHTALVASFSTYRSRGAIRDVGKALGLPPAELERLARLTEGSPRRVAEEIEHLPGAAAKLRSPRWRALGELAAEIGGLPRHLSQHPGGMVISTRPLVEIVPVEPAAMEGRRNCQWDKASWADPGEGGASVRRAPAAQAGGPGLRSPLRPPAPRRVPRGHPRRDHLPGAGARRRHGACRLQRGGGRGPSTSDEPQAEPRRHRGISRAFLRRLCEQRRRPGDRRARLHEDQRLRIVRLPQVARGRFRAPRLPVGLAAPPLPGRVSLCPPERPADGLLPARQPRP